MRRRFLIFSTVITLATLLWLTFQAATAPAQRVGGPSSQADRSRSQSEIGGDTPVEINMLGERLLTRRKVVDLELRNVSGRRLTAVAVRLQFFDEGGKPKHSTYRLSMPLYGPPQVPKSFPDGHVWRESIPTGEINPAAGGKYEATIDYVRFKEASGDERVEWGPDRGGFAGQVTGTSYAYRIERARLKRLYEARGAKAVIDDLNTEMAP